MKLANKIKVISGVNQELLGPDDLGKGPLTLGIFCTKCDAQFELGHEGVTMAVLLNSSFLDYLKFVQSSDCKKCGAKAEQ